MTSGGVGISCALSLYVLSGSLVDAEPVFNRNRLYLDGERRAQLEVGFLIDQLTAMMISVVTFVSCWSTSTPSATWPDERGLPALLQLYLPVHLLHADAGDVQQLSPALLRLGGGRSGLLSADRLLVQARAAIFANLKAFLVNRVGDFGFLLGIAAIAMYTNSLDYAEVFATAPGLADTQIQIWGDSSWSLMTVIGILLFIGAMGKSAQVPLHVWLPDSMEGPTPISALIHAATMVTAGIFMVARMSPLYELSETALSFVLVIGATTAFFTGLIGIVQNDIKRVVAYSTLSQLGYMIVALGASAYAAGIFHLMTHAFFKALLFLGAGSAIIAMHHDQDIRNMGGLRKYMPITYGTMLLGSLALIGFPGFAGFFSKDAIIEAVHHSTIPGSGYAYAMVLAGVFVTAFYSFRMFFLVFHGKERMDAHTREHLKESPAVVTIPLVLLAIPSVVIGAMAIELLLFGDFFQGSIYVAPAHDTLAEIGKGYHGVLVAFVRARHAGTDRLPGAGRASGRLVHLSRKPSPCGLVSGPPGPGVPDARQKILV